MEESFNDFGVNGGYTHSGIDGTFSGIFRIYPDNRFVGTMNDVGEDIEFYRQHHTKLALGILDGPHLNFWKFSFDNNFAPLIYVMDKKGKTYTGRWESINIRTSDLIDGKEWFPPLPELKEAFNAKGLEETLNILGKIEKSRIQEYLHSDLLYQISMFSNEQGYLTLDPLKSLSA